MWYEACPTPWSPVGIRNPLFLRIWTEGSLALFRDIIIFYMVIMFPSNMIASLHLTKQWPLMASHRVSTICHIEIAMPLHSIVPLWYQTALWYITIFIVALESFTRPWHALLTHHNAQLWYQSSQLWHNNATSSDCKAFLLEQNISLRYQSISLTVQHPSWHITMLHCDTTSHLWHSYASLA